MKELWYFYAGCYDVVEKFTDTFSRYFFLFFFSGLQFSYKLIYLHIKESGNMYNISFLLMHQYLQ